MLSELLRTEYKVMNSFIEFSTNSYDDLEGSLWDNYSDSESGKIIVTRACFFELTNNEDDLARIIKELDHLVYFTDLESQCAVVVYFDGDYTNPIITKHNEKVSVFIERLNKVNKELANRSEIILTNETMAKKELRYPKERSKVSTINIKRLLNDLVSKESYVFVCGSQERTNIALYTDPDFTTGEWSLDRKKALIRSLFLDLPIGAIHMNHFDYYEISSNLAELNELKKLDSIVYDGKQRLTTIISFLMGEFSVDFDGEEYFAGNLSNTALTFLINKRITVYETDYDTKEDLLDQYILLNPKND